MRLFSICIILLSLSGCVSMREQLAWLKSKFKRPNSGGVATGYTGGSGDSGDLNRWLQNNTNPPDASCAGKRFAANEVLIQPAAYGSWKKKWNEDLDTNLGKAPYSDILEDGVFSQSYLAKTGCPAYNRMGTQQRKAYVITHLASHCRPESGYNESLVYSECGSSSCWTNYGICQQTPNTVNGRAYGCNVSKRDLLDGGKALSCAALTLNHNMRKLCSGSFPCSKTYWGPMRRSGKTNAHIARMKKYMDRSHPYCKEEYWGNLDREKRARLGEKNDNINSDCQVVTDTARRADTVSPDIGSGGAEPQTIDVKSR